MGERKQMDQETPKMKKFSKQLGKWLLTVARNTIAAELNEGCPTSLKQPAVSKADLLFLKKKMGVFVTLYLHGQLRGCIGTLEPVLSLEGEVVENAHHAAFQDPRFSPLTPQEFLGIDIEISVLTPPEVLNYTSPSDLKKKLLPGIHGVILEKQGAKATFLPQVWDQLEEPEVFLEHLCRKAGLSSHAWKSADVSIRTYTVCSFKEKPGSCH